MKKETPFIKAKAILLLRWWLSDIAEKRTKRHNLSRNFRKNFSLSNIGNQLTVNILHRCFVVFYCSVFEKTNLLLLCKVSLFTCLSSLLPLPFYPFGTWFFPNRTYFCRDSIFSKTKLPLSKYKKVTPFIKSKKQNSFYRNLSRNLKKETPFGSTKLLRHILLGVLFCIQDNTWLKS